MLQRNMHRIFIRLITQFPVLCYRCLGLSLNWFRYVFSPFLDMRTAGLRCSIAKTYLGEELRDICGEADDKGRPTIVTNFPNYAAVVRSLVDECRRLAGRNGRVVCFTTQTMPLTQWFNFDKCPPWHEISIIKCSKNKEHLLHNRVNDTWGDYLKELQKLVREQNILLAIEFS